MAYTAWVRRARRTPRVAAALAAGRSSESVARTICAVDRQAAARTAGMPRTRSWWRRRAAGMGLADLAGLFGEIYEQARSAYS